LVIFTYNLKTKRNGKKKSKRPRTKHHGLRR